MKVREILNVKGNVLYYIRPDSSVLEALKLMSDNDIGSLVVMQKNQLTGMLTFREVINAVAKEQDGWQHQTVEKYMNVKPLSINLDTDIDDLRRSMLEAHCRYAPVIDNNVITGVVSFYDIARAVLENQDKENRLLKAYIRDWPEERD